MMNLSLHKQFTKIFIATLTVVILFSCEKVIKIDIKDAEVQTVVEAFVNSEMGDNQVILSKSANFYEANNFPMIKGADVVITTNDAQYQLQEIQDGIYHHPDLGKLSKDTYKLIIKIEDQIISSESVMPNLVPIDSLTYVEDAEGHPGGGGNNSGTTYKLYLNFDDPGETDNYYKIRITNITSFTDETVYVNDALFNGRNAKLPVTRAMPGDSVVVSLFSIDKANYEYFKLLEANNMGAFTTSVGNPVSNVSGENVIGVFGAYALSIDTLGLPPIK